MVPAPNKSKAYGSLRGPFSFEVATGVAFQTDLSLIGLKLKARVMPLHDTYPPIDIT